MNIEDHQVARIKKWLQEFMGTDRKFARDVYTGAKAMKFHSRAVLRAYKDLGGESVQVGNGWMWQLPAEKDVALDRAGFPLQNTGALDDSQRFTESDVI